MSRPRVTGRALALAVIVGFMYCPWCRAGQASGVEVSASTEHQRQTHVPRNRWFVIAGGTNYHSPLELSEAKVNRKINGTLGLLLPLWKEPTTFKDWSDDGKEWNGWVGVGRDINANWSWFVDAGTAIAQHKETGWYWPVCVPLKIDVHFEHLQFQLEGGLDYYPCGKPALEARPNKHKRVTRSLRATRPFVSLAAGCKRYTEAGGVRLSLPVIGRILHITEDTYYDVLHVSPRLGIETPVTANDSVNVSAGYMFFNRYQNQFNTPIFSVFLRHKF